MTEVYGINVSGCLFKNFVDYGYHPFYAKGKGIYSLDAHFFLKKYCSVAQQPCPDETPCEFYGLEYGVKALNSFSDRTLNIQNVNFISNIVGISLSGIDNASILSNEFKCQKIEKEENDDRFIGGFFIENCNGYHIEADTFYANPFIPGIAYGIGVKNSGPFENEVYNNNLTNLDIGIISIGENRGRVSGLCLKCNDMTNNINDFVVVEEESPPLAIEQGIAYFQGDPNDSTSFEAPAGNTFTSNFSLPADSTKLLYYNYFNSAEDIWYTHHRRQPYPLTYPKDSNYTKETIEHREWHDLEYAKETACPSGIGGGGLKSYTNSRATIIEADNQIVLLNSQLQNLIDGGNTESLNFDVMTSLPDDGLELRSELLADSPYLSDTVLKQSIYKEDVLPNAMIRDILEANPHSAKSQDILNTLNSRQEPMPDYMMGQIMEGKKHVGAKELLEAKIQTWKQIRGKAKADLMRQFLLDTNQMYAMDSVIQFLEDENDLKSKYDLALAYWYEKNFPDALSTLEDIPIEFSLNSNQIAIHNEYEDYFDLLGTIKDSNWLACDLDSVYIQELFELMASENKDLSANARGLLVKGGFYDYIEKVPFPTHLKSANKYPYSSGKNSNINDIDHLKVFPNPTGDYAIIQYDLEDQFKQAFIELSGIEGKLIKIIRIDQGKNQIVMNLKDLPNGLYIISLKSNKQTIESEKLIKRTYK